MDQQESVGLRGIYQLTRKTNHFVLRGDLDDYIRDFHAQNESESFASDDDYLYLILYS
jgi:hypothetical protein